MLLAEYLASKGLLPAGSPVSSAFSAIRAFLFGEEYTVELMLDGEVSSYRFDDLNEALAVLRAEYDLDDRFVPEIEIVAYSRTRDPRFGILGSVASEKSGFNPTKLDTNVHTAAFAAGAHTVPTFGPAPDRVLAVTRSERNLNFPRPPMEFYVEDIEKAVTFYSLTGNWDQMDGRSNL
jgi:hypothetical protein